MKNETIKIKKINGEWYYLWGSSWEKCKDEELHYFRGYGFQVSPPRPNSNIVNPVRKSLAEWGEIYRNSQEYAVEVDRLNRRKKAAMADKPYIEKNAGYHTTHCYSDDGMTQDYSERQYYDAKVLCGMKFSINTPDEKCKKAVVEDTERQLEELKNYKIKYNPRYPVYEGKEWTEKEGLKIEIVGENDL